MTGIKPARRQAASFVLVLSCCGFAVLGMPHSRSAAADMELQPGSMIPQDELVVQEAINAEQDPVTYSLRIFKEPDRIKLKGNLSSEEDYKTLIGLVKANFPAMSLSDRVKVDEAAPDGDVKVGGLSFALKILGYLETGQASVDDNGLSLEGSASTAVVLTEVKNLIENNKPTGVPLKNIRISPPAKSWSASLTADGAIKLSGVLPDHSGKEAVGETMRKMFPECQVEDSTALNANLPASWVKAALHSLKLLRLLDQGSVELTDQTIHLKGAAPSEIALKTIDALAADLPSGFTLRSEVTTPAAYSSGVASFPLFGAMTPH